MPSQLKDQIDEIQRIIDKGDQPNLARLLVQTWLAERMGLMNALEHDLLTRKNAREQSLVDFLKDYRKLDQVYAENLSGHIFDDDEFYICGGEDAAPKIFMVTNKYLYLYARKKSGYPLLILPWDDIHSYKNKIGWTGKMWIEMKSGETLYYEKVESAPHENVVSLLLDGKVAGGVAILSAHQLSAEAAEADAPEGVPAVPHPAVDIVAALEQKDLKADSGKYVRKMVSGILWAVGGTVATVWSYQSTEGTYYFVFWGAIVFGAWDFLCGLFGLMMSEA